MAGRAAIREDLVVITTLETLVAEEVNGGILDARDILLRLDMLETVRLVPTRRVDIERNLPANSVASSKGTVRIRRRMIRDWVSVHSHKSVIREFLLERFDHISSDIVLFVIPRRSLASIIRTQVSTYLYTVYERNKTHFSKSCLSSILAFLPTGLTFTIPFRNSTNVPLFRGNFNSEMYLRQKSARF